jgi:hypothetical protein
MGIPLTQCLALRASPEKYSGMTRKDFYRIAGDVEIRVHELRSEENIFRSLRIAQNDIGVDHIMRDHNLDAFVYHHKAQNFVDEAAFSVLCAFESSVRKQMAATS